MVTLYYSPQSRAIRPRWMLEEIGAPYQLERLNLQAGDQKRPAYLKINPNGTVPAIVDGDLVLFESAAICQYLADKHPEARLAPSLGSPDRARYYQWIHFAMSGLEPPAVNVFLHTMGKPEADRLPAVVEESRRQLAAALRVTEAAVAGRSFIVGDRLTTADVMIGSTLAWAQMMGLIGADLPATTAYLTGLGARPAFQRTMAD
jgi:glutathione S-transferase